MLRTTAGRRLGQQYEADAGRNQAEEVHRRFADDVIHRDCQGDADGEQDEPAQTSALAFTYALLGPPPFLLPFLFTQILNDRGRPAFGQLPEHLAAVEVLPLLVPCASPDRDGAAREHRDDAE